MRRKLMLLVLALAAVIGALASAPASARGCGWVCSAPGCCNFCCIDQPCALPICD